MTRGDGFVVRNALPVVELNCDGMVTFSRTIAVYSRYFGFVRLMLQIHSYKTTIFYNGKN